MLYRMIPRQTQLSSDTALIALQRVQLKVDSVDFHLFCGSDSLHRMPNQGF